jgi:hypothetical protein
MSSVEGELVTEAFEYDGGRQVTVYFPPEPLEAVVFAGDGQLISSWGGDLETADVPSTMIVGVHLVADETLRLHEYSPGFESARFAAHEAFFVRDVGRWARSRFGVALPAERTAVLGVSASGELALAMGFGIRTSTVRFCAPLRAPVASRLARCLTRFRARTWWPARWSRSSARTRFGGQSRCAIQVRTL